jgi:uncharacterized membrane protein
MELFSTRLVLSPPAWPVVLSAAALAMLAAEYAMLLHWLWAGRSARRAWGLTAAAILAGPVVAPVGGLWGLASRGAGEGFGHWTVVKAGAWGTLAGGLVLLAVFGGPAGALAAIGGCAVLWAVRSYRRTTSPLRRRTKALLLALRILVLLLVVLWALRPTLERRFFKDVYATILIGIDESLSMATPDMTPAATPAAAGQEDRAISRLDAVRRALVARHEDLARLEERAEVRVYTFAAAASQDVELPGEPAEWPAMLPAANKPVTAIGDATSEAVTRLFRAGKDVAAVLLITDGRNNASYRHTPDRLMQRLSERGVRIYALQVGRGEQDPAGVSRVLSVRELTAPERVETFNNLPISATVEAVGLAGREVEVECRFGEEVLRTQRVPVVAERQVIDFSHVHVPHDTGTRRLTVTARCLGDPPRHLTGAPSAGWLVHVRDSGLRILYIEGKIRPEEKFVAQALATAKRFALDRRILIQPLKAGARPALSEELDGWLRYHVILLGDVGPEHFTAKQQELLRRLVDEHGKGFCMIGGRRSFEEGLWAGTPVAKMMPVDLGESTGKIDGEVKVVPTPQGRKSDIMRVGAEGQDVADAWDKLDKLPGASRLRGVKPTAQVLAATSPDHGEAPLIVRQSYGKGRTLAIAFDMTWRWVISLKDTAETQRRFWRQVALYLAAPKGNVWIETDKPTYDLRRLRAGEEAITVTAGVEDGTGAPVTSPRPAVSLVHPDGRTTETLKLTVDEAARKFRGVVDHRRLAPTDDKPYVLKVSAEMDGKEVASEYRFEVAYPVLDSRDTLADLELLRRLARGTRGEFRRLDQAGVLLRQLRVDTEPKKQPQVERRDLARDLRWPAIAAMIALLCLEWAIRKRKGLV